MSCALNLCHVIGSIATLNPKRPVHRPHIQDLVHMLGRMPTNCVLILGSIATLNQHRHVHRP